MSKYYLISCLDPHKEDLRGLPDTLRDLDLARGMKTGIFFLSLTGALLLLTITGLWGLLPNTELVLEIEFCEPRGRFGELDQSTQFNNH